MCRSKSSDAIAPGHTICLEKLAVVVDALADDGTPTGRTKHALRPLTAEEWLHQCADTGTVIRATLVPTAQNEADVAGTAGLVTNGHSPGHGVYATLASASAISATRF